MIITNNLKVAIHDTATVGLVQQQFGKMAGLVLNSTAVILLNFCAKPNICPSISATSPSCKTIEDKKTSVQRLIQLDKNKK